MVFKWFRARITMNRMPKHSTAVAGSYRSVTSFDSPTYPPNTNGTRRSESESSIKQTTLPILANPMASLSNITSVKKNETLDNDDKPSIASTKSLNDLTMREDIYDDFLRTEPNGETYGSDMFKKLSKQKFEETYNENIGRPTQEPAAKMHKAELPILANPMAGLSDSSSVRKDETSGDDSKPPIIASSKSLNDLTMREDMYGDYFHTEPDEETYGSDMFKKLSKQNFEETYNENVGNSTPKPVAKMHKAEFKKKKAKAPVPKMLGKGSGSSVNAASSKSEFVTLEKKRTSQDSDIEV